MGTWTAIVIAAALGAAEDSKKTQFDFEGPSGAVTLGTQSGVLREAGKSRKTPAALSVQVQDRVEGEDATYGDTAELTAHFRAGGNDVELRLTQVGFPPGSEVDVKQRPKEALQGGVALVLPESDEGGPASLRLWGTGEVLVDGKVATDKALISLVADETRRSKVTMRVRGLPEVVSASGEWELSFRDAVVMVDGQVAEPVEAPLPVLAFSPAEGEAATGTGGAGGEGTDAQRDGQAAGGQEAAGASQAPGASQATGASRGSGAPQTTGSAPSGAAPQQTVGAAQQYGSQAAAAPSATGLPTAGAPAQGTGGAGTAGLGEPAPLTGIDYGTSTSSLGPIFPAAPAPSSQGGQFGSVGYPALGGAPLPQEGASSGGSLAEGTPVGTPGVPGSAAASPGSATGLSEVAGSQVSPGIPASPPVLNNGQFPPGIQPPDGTTTSSPGIPSSPPVLNNGRSLVGQPAVPGNVTGTAGANPVTAPGTGAGQVGPVGPATGSGSTNR